MRRIPEVLVMKPAQHQRRDDSTTDRQAIDQRIGDQRRV